MVGLGFEITGEIGSNRIDATWQAEGDACRVVSDACDTSGNGQISYSEPDVSVDVGRLRAGDFSPAQDAHVRLTNFRYHLNQLLIDLYAYLQLDWDIDIWPVNTSGTFKTPPLLIYSFAQTLPIYPEFSVHAGTPDALRTGPIPVVSPIQITKTADKVLPVPIGDVVTVTSIVRNVGTRSLSEVTIIDNGTEITRGATLPGSNLSTFHQSAHRDSRERSEKRNSSSRVVTMGTAGW